MAVWRQFGATQIYSDPLAHGWPWLLASVPVSYEPADAPEVIASGPWFTWHGDRCLLPGGPTELARNALCTQAYRVGRTVGVQFHPEATAELVGSWVAKCPPGYFASHATTADAVMAGFAAEGAAARRRSITLFDWFLDEVAPS